MERLYVISLLLSHCPYANAIRFIQATTKAVVDLSSQAVSPTAFRQSIRLLKRCFNVYHDVLVWVNGGFDWSMGVRVIASISAGWQLGSRVWNGSRGNVYRSSGFSLMLVYTESCTPVL